MSFKRSWQVFSAGFLAALSAPISAQSPSEAPIETPSAQSAETSVRAQNIARLIEVWGFVKYHHPDAASGQLAMDDEFFALYPNVRAATSAEEADAMLADWLDELGRGAPCDPCVTASDPALIALASATPQWLDTLPGALATPLEDIFINRAARQAQSSVRSDKGSRKSVFSNEADYSQVWRKGDEALWGLTLARAWSALQYWFPYRDVMDEGPAILLRRAAEGIIAANTSVAYQNALSRFVAGSDDGHANIPQFYPAFFPRGARCTIPYSLRFIEGRLVVDGRSVLTGGPLEAGDVLLRIDGEDAQKNAVQVRPFIAASNDDALGRNLMATVRLGPCRMREVSVERADQEITVAVEWQDYTAHQINSFAPHYQPGPTIEKLPGDITYVRYQQLQEGDVERLRAMANAGRGLVLDMRGHVTANLIPQIGGMLVEQRSPIARFSIPSIATPGEFVWQEPALLSPRDDGQRINVPVVAIIDHSAKSASEFVAMALRAAGVPLVGSRTAGADGNVTTMPLPTGGGMNFSGIGVYYPDRSPTQRVGIVPDIKVKPTIAGIAAGRDEVLERALEHLRSMRDDSKR